MPTKKSDRSAFQTTRQADAQKLSALRKHIKAGVDALEHGDFIEVDAQELKAYVKRLAAAVPH
jgi:hypothetical protein